MRRLSVLSVLLLAACAPAAQPAAHGSGSMPQAGTAQPADGILGDYTLTLAASDFPASTPQEMRSRGAGTWGFAFHTGNHFVVSHNGQQVAQGPYQVSGNQVTFGTGESGPYACNVPAAYSWRLSNGQLTFTLVGTDACDGRVLALTTRPFTRTP